MKMSSLSSFNILSRLAITIFFIYQTVFLFITSPCVTLVDKTLSALLLILDNWFIAYFQLLIGRCSLVYGASIMQDRDLNEYSPARSSTSKNLPCGHELCDSSSNCRSSTQSCPYTVEYYSANTSSSGMLFEDILLLSSISATASNTSLQASIILGSALHFLSFIYFLNLLFLSVSLYQLYDAFIQGYFHNNLSTCSQMW